MRTLRAWLSRVVGFLRPGRAERDFAEELQSHLDHHIDDNLRAGMTPIEARRQAMIKLGSVAAVTEAQRERRGLPWIESILQDVRYSIRAMRRRPTFAAACIVTLALGIGANSAIFSVVNGVLFAPLPYEQPERLVTIWIRSAVVQRDDSPMSAPDMDALRRTVKAADVEAFQAAVIPSTLVIAGEGVPVQGVLMTPALFRMLGRAPLLGRLLEENDASGTVVISHAFWQRKFGGDPGVIGRAISDGRRALTIVGVMPPEFLFPYPSMMRASVSFTSSTDVDFWMDLQEMIAADKAFRDRRTRLIGVVARLKDGVSVDAARAEIETAWARLAQEYPENRGWEARVVPLHEQAVGSMRRLLWSLLGSVAMVLIVACANVANLLLARGMARHRELALRSALGADRRRLLQQVLIESLTLSLCGAAVGIALAKVVTPLLVSWAPAGTPRLSEISVSWMVAIFTAAIAVICGLIVGVIPGFVAARTEVRRSIDEGARGSTAGRHRLRGMLVAAQLALAVVLSVGAGLLTRSFIAVLNTDPGFRSDHLLTLQVSVPRDYSSTAEKHLGFYQKLLARLEAVPGVVSVGGTTRLPLGGANSSTTIAIEGRVPADGEWPEVDFRRAVHHYFETMGIPVRSGRIFTDADGAGAPPVVVINESLANKFFAAEDPIGRQIRLGASSPVRAATIVGVVGDLRHQRLDAAPNPEVYVNYLQALPYAPLLVLRTTADPAQLGPSIRQALRDVDPALLPSNVRTMGELRSASVAPRIFLMVLIGAFGLLALTLAGVGVYGVLSLIVAERTREIGIRLALGASPRGMIALIVNRALAMTLGGVGIGVLLALGLSPVVASQLYGVTAGDPATLGATAAGLVAIGLVAAVIPAARAMRVDPVKTLRCD